MRKRWLKAGFSPSEEMIWWLGQIVFGLLLIVALYAFIANSISGGTLAQRVYANDFSLLATIAAHSPDNLITSQQVNKFKDAEFSINLKTGTVDVLAKSLRGAGSMWLFSQDGIAIVPTTIDKATGVVRVVKEDGKVRLLTEGGAGWRFRMLACPAAGATSGLPTRTNAVIAPADGPIGTLADIIQARLGPTTLRATHVNDPRLNGIDGVAIALVSSKKPSIIALYGVEGASSAVSSAPSASAALACAIVNAALRESALDKGLLGAATAPILMPPGAAPMVFVTVPETMLKETALANAIVKGVQGNG